MIDEVSNIILPAGEFQELRQEVKLILSYIQEIELDSAKARRVSRLGFLNSREAAHALGISLRTLHTRLQSGELASHGEGRRHRFDAAAVYEKSGLSESVFMDRIQSYRGKRLNAKA